MNSCRFRLFFSTELFLGLQTTPNSERQTRAVPRQAARRRFAPSRLLLADMGWGELRSSQPEGGKLGLQQASIWRCPLKGWGFSPWRRSPQRPAAAPMGKKRYAPGSPRESPYRLSTFKRLYKVWGASMISRRQLWD
jgi:hypothetical protein